MKKMKEKHEFKVGDHVFLPNPDQISGLDMGTIVEVDRNTDDKAIRYKVQVCAEGIVFRTVGSEDIYTSMISAGDEGIRRRYERKA